MEYNIEKVEKFKANSEERKQYLIDYFKGGVILTSGILKSVGKEIDELDKQILAYDNQLKLMYYYQKKIDELEVAQAKNNIK